MSRQEHIKVSDLKKGFLYYVDARNSRYAIWLGDTSNTFILSRHKFGANFLDEEYHYDNGPPYGTVRPWREIGKAPFEMTSIENRDEEVLQYLNSFMKGDSR